jgi:ATPase subunit of ABC transporter with duplicated ATPase domains
MALINIQNLGVTLGEPLFDGLTVTINKGDRLGLVAANGVGKSTLLSCINGEIAPTTGDITSARGLHIGYVKQHPSEADLAKTLYELVLAALPAEQADYEAWRVDVALDDLSLPYNLHGQTLAQLSGGWQRQAMLAAAWVTAPDVLLLDEPTNHLDLARIGILQNWLAKLPRDTAVIITSHDRAFLDETTQRTLFLRTEASRDFALPYSRARDALEEADAADERRFANDMRQAQQWRKQAAKLKNIGINSGSDLLVKKTKQLSERAAALEISARPSYKDHSAGDIKLTNSGTHAKALLTLKDVTVCTPDGRALYQTGHKWINRGDRVLLLGANGTGKTQLVRMLHAALIGKESPIKYAASLQLGYSDQALSQLDSNMTPLETIIQSTDIGDQRARGLLAGAGMRIDLQDTPLNALSGGQRARLAMLKLRLDSPNFYLLDEPTNHLDIDGQQSLENELIEHETSCLLVSHDRNFVRNVANKFWLIDRKKLIEIDSPEPFFKAAMSGGHGVNYAEILKC